MSEHQVLARKYRSQSLDELVGQEVLVTTLANAIKQNRLAHAYLFTGIRGVGKTSTARILAKSLNCVGADGSATAPQVKPCGTCGHCVAIAESRHMDVIEMDAASHTGVDDIREIIEGAKYKPTSARFKVYIIDEVHMLSKSAFNALLKTLEEPPPFVKFIFATTEIRKVPATILSRCQRFDLARIPQADLARHLRKIADLEGVKIDEDAIGVIAKVADGSARDGLSFLDQAIANCDGTITADKISASLGLAGKGVAFDIFEAVIGGDMSAVGKSLDVLRASSAEPSLLLADLLEITHYITRVKLANGMERTLPLTPDEQKKVAAFAGRLSIAQLARIWQMLVKGFTELPIAPSESAALEMILIRVAYAGLLPTPAEILAKVESETSGEVQKKNN